MNLAKEIAKIPKINIIRKLAKDRNIPVYLVGGFLRDLYLREYKIAKLNNRSRNDYDFCLENNVHDFVKLFAKVIKAKYIILDDKNDSYRVIIKTKADIFTYDFTRMVDKDIANDLPLRDFSINMLAFDLLDKKSKIIDYCSSIEDIRHRKIRSVKEEAIINDPLRILRGFSFMANLGFDIEPKTLDYMLKHKGLIKSVSCERINEEMFKILALNHSFKALDKMDNLRILSEIIPYIDESRGVRQGGYHHLDVWKHSKETLRQFELLYNNILVKRSDICDYLNQDLAKDRRRLYILKLACLLHDIGKPRAKKRKKKRTIFYTHEKIGRDLAGEIAFHLRLSFREKDLLTKLIFWHLRPGYLADQEKPSKKAIYRFFRDTQEEGVAVILLALSDWRATCGRLIDSIKRKKHERIMLRLIDHYFKEAKEKPIPQLVNGYDIMRKFNLSSGPLIGDILRDIKEAQALSKVKNKQEAFILAKKIISKNKK